MNSDGLRDFDPIQRADLQRLWDVQTREMLDVTVASQAESKDRPVLSSKRTYGHILRLHNFFLHFLKKVLQENFQMSEDFQLRLDHDKMSYVKDFRQSCLKAFARFFIPTRNEDGSFDIVRLRGGRRIFQVQYGEIMAEIDHFEFKGQASDEQRRNLSFGAFLHHLPIDAIPVLNVSMALAIVSVWRDIQPPSTQPDTASLARLERYLDSSRLTIRLLRVTPPLKMADIKTGLLKKFISVKGHVVKARHKRLRVVTADFTCCKCGEVTTHAFHQGRFSFPTKCTGPECRSRTFTLQRSTARYTNVQELRLQEVQEESTMHAGRTPRQIEVEIKDDLIDACRPGDTILLACYVDAVNTALAAGRAGKRAMETSTYKLFLQAHSITTTSESNRPGHSSSEEGKQILFTKQQMQNITQLCHADHRCFSLVERRAFPFDLLVRSLCPSIIGHHEVKAGILLCLLGGTPPSSQSFDRGNSIRSNSHILIVGDPGMGKSQMLLAATQLAARSVYVGGTTASTTGLTVTLTKEEGGETGIEAGALVLADQGVACIDELDKCKNLDGLLEAMEQQQVSIAKAGAVASLPARCSIVAAANPKHGSYSLSKTVAENLNMARPILSRFDLVFILRDRADKEQDRLVSSNIMNLYRNGRSNVAASTNNLMMELEQQRQDQIAQQQQEQQERGDGNANGGSGRQRTVGRHANRVPLGKRLAWVSSFNEPLPASLVREYISYAREYCKPKLTPEAAAVLKEYYLKLRYPGGAQDKYDTVPITTRQLEALIRLSQARAKACLREFVLREDALDVVELLECSVEQVHTDEFGIVDRSRGGAAGLSNRKMRKLFIQHVHRIIGVGGMCTMDDLRRVADRVECSISEFQTLIDDMRSNGLLIKKSDGRFEVLA